MNHRFLASMSALGVVTVLVLLTPILIAGQSPLSAAKTRTPPHTPDGKPDLQGIWTNATVTPLERPRDLAGKEFLTETEAAEFEKLAVYDADGDRRDGGAEADVGRAYNEFWRDRGKVVSTMRSSLIVDPPDGKVPPLLPEAQKRNADLAAARRKLGGPFDGPEGRSLQERCLLTPQAGPPMLPANYNSNYQIVQTPDYVAILVEMIHDARIIPLDGRPHLGSGLKQWMGDSRGRWEGETLVVETRNFNDKIGEVTGNAMRLPNGDPSGVRYHGVFGTADTTLVERFTRVDAKTIDYRFTVTAPKTFVKPWTAVAPMTKLDGRVFEYACHEG